MSSTVRKFGRVQVIGKDGTRHHFEVSDCDGMLLIAPRPRQRNRPASKTTRLQFQNPPPVEPPPNEPQKPPVKEPPTKDPDRKPPYQPPVKAALDAAEWMALGA